MSFVSNRYAIAVVAVLVLTAGCSQLTGEGPITFSADDVSVSDAAVNGAGFQQEADRTVPINRSIELQGNERRVEITNHVSVYSKSINGSPVSFFVAFSTPKAEMFGQALNPLGTYDKKRLLKRVASQRSEVRDLEHTGTFSATILGNETTVDTFSATTRMRGQEMKVTLQIARVPHGGDFVIAVGGYPQGYDGQGAIETMMAGIEHPA